MAEWLKAHAWKACIPQGIQGSNPCLSAINPSKPCVFLRDYPHTLDGQSCAAQQVRTIVVNVADFFRDLEGFHLVGWERT